MSIEVMKQALEACERLYIPNFTQDNSPINNCITALRQAIEQAEKQEPYGYFRYDIRLDAWVQSRDSDQGVAFYTHPPKREWVELTDEQIEEIADGYLVDYRIPAGCALNFARDIEAAHGIKENT